MNPSSNLELWNRLAQAGLTTGMAPPPFEGSDAPWFVRVMQGFGGWLASVFLIGFVLLFFGYSYYDDWNKGLFEAIGTLVAAFLLLRGSKSDFRTQFGLSLGFASQILFWMAFDRMFDYNEDAQRWFAFALLEAGIAIALPSFMNRVCTGYIAAVALTTGLLYSKFYFLTSALLGAAYALIWLEGGRGPKPASLLQPVGYGIALALAQTVGFAMYLHPSMSSDDAAVFNLDLIRGAALSGIILVLAVGRLLQRSGRGSSDPAARFAILGTLALGALSLKAAGISTGFLILILGRANSNRILIGLGILALLFYASLYYYWLDTSLLQKSIILAATGAGLLLARVLLRFFLPAREVSHA